MLKTRIIPVLLLKNGRMVKGKQFSNYRDVGDPVSAARIYNAQKADELIFLDIDASNEDRGTLLNIIKRVSQECFMPFTVGGGIRTIDDVRNLLTVGADKVSINSAAVTTPKLIREVANFFGKQCIIVSVDAKRIGSSYHVFSHSGKIHEKIRLIDHIKMMQDYGAGEILINSIDQDGMMNGYDAELIRITKDATSLPVIACGGAGNFQHLEYAIKVLDTHAVACASLFHFGDNNPIRARSYLKNRGIPVKLI